MTKIQPKQVVVWTAGVLLLLVLAFVVHAAFVPPPFSFWDDTLAI